jgi:uncharacterized protein YdhG (YjbR/CyaY superfamily)
MISKALDVKTYIEEASADRRAALQKLRALCRKLLPGCEECIEYGMPAYKRNGTMELSFASQKQYIALYVKPDVVNEFRAALLGCDIGKSCIRFRRPDSIDFEVVGNLLRRTAASPSAAC